MYIKKGDVIYNTNGRKINIFTCLLLLQVITNSNIMNNVCALLEGLWAPFDDPKEFSLFNDIIKQSKGIINSFLYGMCMY